MLSTKILTEIFGKEFLPALQKVSKGQESQGKQILGESSTSSPAPTLRLEQELKDKTPRPVNTSWPNAEESTSTDQEKHGASSKSELLSHALTLMLDSAAEESLADSLETQSGQLGPKIVKFDIDAHVGSFIVSSDRLGVSSQCNFGTVRANACVFKGKWQFEIQLGSKGVMQIGWVTHDTKFSVELGVGDTEDSYAFDGNRVRKWNVSSAPYGDNWQSGDLIGCCINLDEGNISYYRNGKPLGVAFTNIYHGPGITYFPAASLAFNENVVANFGASPFQFPVSGFLPIQSQKTKEDSKVRLLLTWMEHLLNLYPNLNLSGDRTPPALIPMTKEDSITVLLAAERIFQLLVPNIHSAFIVERRILPFFAKKMGLLEKINHRDKLILQTPNYQKTSLFLDLFWTFLEEAEMQNLMERLCIILMNYYRSNALSRHYPYQHYSLRCLIAFANHRKTRRHLIHHIFFEKTKITNFLHTKPYDEEVLKEILPAPWWEGKVPESTEPSEEYVSAYNLIKDNVHNLELLHIQLLKLLMTNSDGTEKRPSSRSVFLRKLRQHIREAIPPGSLIQHSISRAMCVFFRLLKLVEILWMEEIRGVTTHLPDIPASVFYDTSINYYDLERVGGLANYLYKTYHEEVSASLQVPDYFSNTQTTDSYSETPMPSFFALSGLANAGGGPSAPLITITAVRNNQGSENRSNAPSPAGSTETEVQTSDSYAESTGTNLSNMDDISTGSGIIGIFQGPQSSPNTESQTESVPVRGNRSATSSGEISSTTMGGGGRSGIAGTSLLAGTQSGHNMLIPMYTDFRSALAHHPRLTLFPGGLLSFPNYESRPGMRPYCAANEHAGRDSGSMDITLSLRELLDDVIILYNCGVSAHVDKVGALRVTMADYVKHLRTTNQNLKDKRVSAEVKAEFHKSIEIFTTKLEDQSRFMAWIQGAIFTPERQKLVADLLTSLVATLKKASGGGPLFAFVPEIYLTTLIQLNGLLLNEMHPTVSFRIIPGIKPLFRDVAEFVALHFADSRIVIAETKDSLTQALTTFISDRTMLTALEEMPEVSRIGLMESILRPYENRAWAQSNWLLMRVWQGNGFGFQYPNSTQTRNSIKAKSVQDEFGISRNLPPLPSQILQSHISSILLGNQKFATTFVHSVLNQLNWAFSEFIGLLQEIQSAANRPERVYIESRQLRICSTCFELTQALLRVLEMTLNLAPQIITDPARESSDALLGRLCMLVCQVLNRIGSATGSFAQVLDLSVTGLESVTYYPLLAGVSGILVALLKSDLRKTNAAELGVTKTLLREPSFQISSIEFLLGQDITTPAFTFRSHVPMDLTEPEIQLLEKTILHLKTWGPKLELDAESISDDEVCTICYAYPKSTTFKPCNHRACRTCIVHHLMNRGDCFFCKGIIQKVISDDGAVIHDITLPSQPPSTTNTEG